MLRSMPVPANSGIAYAQANLHAQEHARASKLTDSRCNSTSTAGAACKSAYELPRYVLYLYAEQGTPVMVTG